jgi:hypothetical protein
VTYKFVEFSKVANPMYMQIFLGDDKSGRSPLSSSHTEKDANLDEAFKFGA